MDLTRLSFCGCLVSLLCVSAIKSPSPPQGQKPTKVVLWRDVMEPASCQARQTVVQLSRERPGEISFLFKPSCVVLRRCSGCCNAEHLNCVAVNTSYINLQILKLRSGESQLVEIPFIQHDQCECRPRTNPKAITVRRECEPCGGRRRHSWDQDPGTCECRCRLSHQKCHRKRQQLNHRTCRCDHLRR